MLSSACTAMAWAMSYTPRVRPRTVRWWVMSREYENLKKLWDTRFTPVTPEVVELLELVKAEHDGTWDELAAAVGIRVRQLRRIRNKHKTVSLRVMDQILARSGYGYRLHTLPWYTVDELI